MLPTPTPLPRAAPGRLSLVALGDSLTRGAGDDGHGGYPARVAEKLRAGEQSVDVVNVAVDGSETTDLLSRLSLPETKARLASAGLVLVSIGGNDLSHSLPAEFTSSGGSPVLEALPRAKKNLERILATIREANASVPVRVLGLYSPFEGGGGARRERQVILEWNVALEETCVAFPGVVFVPIADLFEERPERLGADRFHPGAEGYDEIAHRVFSSLPASLAKPSPGTGS